MTLHSDHSIRVVVDATDLHAGQPGERALEQRDAHPESRITLRSLKAGETISHDGKHLLEVLVVRGQVNLKGETLGSSSYVRLAPGVPAMFTSTEASMVYLNEHTPTEPEADSFALRGNSLDWRQGMVPGLKVTSLHQGLTKHTALVRWAPETRFNPHTHVGGEEILVLEGVFRDEHGSYPAGTWIRSPHLSNHRPFTGPEGATILVKVGHLDVA
ncbi:MAG: cupin domain-containing protein [Verrucomicrobiota bacterium]|jgi:ChrR Cupin-like domain